MTEDDQPEESAPIEEIALRSLDHRVQRQIENAKKSIVSGNFDYAFEICMNILRQHPGCLDVRKVLRRAQVAKRKAASKKSSKFLDKVTSAPFSIMGSSLVKKDPEKAMDQAEKMLCDNPENIMAHRMLAHAAENLELLNTAAYGFELARQVEPDNFDNLKELGNVYLKLKQYDDAIKIGNHVFQKNQGDGEAQELVKQASVAQSMEKGNWEGDEDFRSKLKDQDEAIALEQEARNVNDDDALLELIERAKIRVNQKPEDLSNYREIATSYRKLGDMASAVEWVGYARELESGQADVALEEMESQYYLEWMQQEIASMEAQLEDDPSNEELQEYIETARGEEQQYRYHQAARMVEKYPNDYGYQFELGQLLFDMGYTDDSIQHLQSGVRSPKHRLKSIVYLGRAFKAKGFYDMAASQLETAKTDSPQMDETKKEIIYELASCYELNGDPEKAIEEFKEIYNADVGYLDVADKINAYYSGGG